MVNGAISVVFAEQAVVVDLSLIPKCTARGASQELFCLGLHNSNVKWFEFPSSFLCDGCHYKMEYCRCITQQSIHNN